MNIIDHGHHDPLEFDLGETWQVVARVAAQAIEAQRQERNARDAQRPSGGEQG